MNHQLNLNDPPPISSFGSFFFSFGSVPDSTSPSGAGATLFVSSRVTQSKHTVKRQTNTTAPAAAMYTPVKSSSESSLVPVVFVTLDIVP